MKCDVLRRAFESKNRPRSIEIRGDIELPGTRDPPGRPTTANLFSPRTAHFGTNFAYIPSIGFQQRTMAPKKRSGGKGTNTNTNGSSSTSTPSEKLVVWSEMDATKAVDYLSSQIERIKQSATPPSGAPPMPNEMYNSARILLAFGTQDTYTEIFTPTQYFYDVICSREDRWDQEKYEKMSPLLKEMFPEGQLPWFPPPIGFVRDFVVPRIILPLFVRRYCLLRDLVLVARMVIQPTTKQLSADKEFGKSGCVLSADSKKLVDRLGVTLRALEGVLMQLVTWTVNSDAISMRMALDVVLLDSLAKIAGLALWLLCKTAVVGGLEDVDGTCAVVSSARLIFRQILTRNPSYWIKFQKERNPPEVPMKGLSPPALARKMAANMLIMLDKPTTPPRNDVEDFPSVCRQMVPMMSLILGERATPDAESELGYKFEPDRGDWVHTMASILQYPEEFMRQRKLFLKDFCDVCGKAADLKRCSKCLVGRFCSAECQRTGYSEHKKVCFDGKAARTEGLRPSQIVGEAGKEDGEEEGELS